MSSLDQSNTKPAASTAPDSDPALDRDASGNSLPTPRTPSSGDQPSPADGSHYLQNAHYGALDDDTPTSGNADQASRDGHGSPPPPPADLADGGKGARNTSDEAAAPSRGGDGGTADTAPSSDAQQTVNRQGPSHETFSLNGSGYQTVSEHGPAASAPLAIASFSESANAAPTDIALSNASVDENAAGAIVGTLTTIDPDVGETFSYTVSDDRFEVVDGHLKLKDGISLDHEGEPSVSVTVTSMDSAGHSISESFTITVANVNEAPSDIVLSHATVAENAAGAVVGALAVADPDAGDTHTYNVSDGRFEIVDGQLKLKDGVSLDHEAEPHVTVQVTATDAGGLSVTQSFTLTVANVNEAPTDIALSNATVNENAAGAVVGTLSATDPDAGDTHSYSVSDGRFEIVDGQLKLKEGVALDHEAEPSVTVQVTATDAGGLSISENFTITVADVNEAPTGIALSNATVVENATGAFIGTLTASDPDAGDSQNFSVSDSRFEVVGNQLKLKAGVSLDYEATPSVSVDVTATDSGGLSITQSFTIAVTDVVEINVINGTPRNDTLNGTGGVDLINGLAGNDTISGGGGDDFIVGGQGNDTLDGGAGSDTYRTGVGDGFDRYADTGASGTDVVVATADNTAIGLQSGYGPASGIEEISSGGFANVSIQGNTSNDTLDFSTTTLTGIAKIDGGAGNDTITGSAGDDTIVGGAGSDTLKGGDGSDTYQIGAGAGFDTVQDTGASGNDKIAATADNVVIGLTSGFGPGSGIEEISSGGFANVSIQGNTSNDTLDFSATTLTGITKIDGGAGNDTITGSAGDDTIVGGAGNDTLKGGGGGDTYQIGTGAGFDTYQDTGASGPDKIVATADNVAIGLTSGFGPASGIEEISSGGFANVSIQGNTSSDTLDFSATTLTGISKIDGGAGNDTITGSAGDDTIVGGAGNDTLKGGGGSDTYQIGIGSGFDSYQDTGAWGTDKIVATADNVAIGLSSGFGPASGIEEISSGGFANVSVQGSTSSDTLDFSATTLTGIAKIDGGNGNDTITGSAGADTIVGGAGNDTLKGGDGGDTYQIGTGAGFDTFQDSGASGTDMIVATADNAIIGLTSGFGPASGIEQIGGGGFANVTIQGNTSNDTLNFSATTLTGIARIDGGAGNDTITGSAGNDTIYGGTGNDTIVGGDGGDTVAGGAGADTLSGGNGSDTLSYAQSSAAVTVDLAHNLASGGDAQGDTIAGFENVTGSNYDDVISGDANNNVIDAGAGNDRVYSSWGLDTIDGGTGSDTIDLANFNGLGDMTIDLSQGLVYFSGYVAGADHVSNFENASATTGNDTLIGGSGDNTMSGGAGNDTIWFSTNAGHDTVMGGAGSDFIRIDTGGGSGGWLEAIADGSTPTLAAGDWLLQLDSGETYVLHGAGVDFDFGGVHAGVLTAADGSTMTFQEIEGLHW